jgi:hypothetical protein
MIHFPRTALAEQLVVALQGKDPFGDAQNGLFLTAPRRTGKSTFLQTDLKPALERAGVRVVYVDLWSAPRRNPGILVSSAIGQALQSFQGVLTKLAKSQGISKLRVGGILELDPRSVGQLDGATLPAALDALQVAAAAPIALIVDEAQHALTSEMGEATMTALKSARDQMNSPGKVRLMLIMSGSDRDKLLRLVHTAAAPFYGSQIKPMPVLGFDFIEFVAEAIEKHHTALRPVNRATLLEAFQHFGARPQFFLEALGQVLSPFSGGSQRPEEAVLAAARDRESLDQKQMESDYLGLRPLEQAVLWRLLAMGAKFRPYDAAALKFYSSATGQRIGIAKAQKALESLRTRQPPVAWKSAHGEYAVEDAAMHRWFEQRSAAKLWPPMPDAVEGDATLPVATATPSRRRRAASRKKRGPVDR